MLIRFICVNYNNFGDTEKFCESLLAQLGRDREYMLHCVVVDNSTDHQDSQMLESFTSHYPWISYRRPSGNLGYFGGLNFGLEMKTACDERYVVISNNDIIFEQDFCRKLIGKSYDPKVFSICPDVITSDGIHQNPHVLNKMSWFHKIQYDVYYSHFVVARIMLQLRRLLRPVKASQSPRPGACEIHMGIGACYVLTAEFLRRFRKLHFPFFLYGEEAYFSDQIHSAGGILWYDPDFRVHHTESAATSKLPRRTVYELSRKGYRFYRSML